MSVVFKVGNTDYTKNVVCPNYIVNEKDIYEEWSDGSHKFRRTLIRTRISGSISVLFDDIDEYDAFLRALRNGRSSEGTVSCTVYVNNADTTKTSNFYLSYDPNNPRPFLGIKNVDPLEITIEER